MQFKSIVLVLGATATCLMASPLAARDSTDILTPNDYTEHRREKTANGGSLIFYGPPIGSKSSRSEAPNVEERASCSYNAAPTCSTSHTARNDICDQLVTELQGDATVAVGQSPRQICYEGAAAESNQYCCVSWHNVVPGLTKGDLSGYASTMLSTCTSNGISGKTNSVWVHNTCTSVCLSNRGTGC